MLLLIMGHLDQVDRRFNLDPTTPAAYTYTKLDVDERH